MQQKCMTVGMFSPVCHTDEQYGPAHPYLDIGCAIALRPHSSQHIFAVFSLVNKNIFQNSFSKILVTKYELYVMLTVNFYTYSMASLFSSELIKNN
jgi:hypothetical protein